MTTPNFNPEPDEHEHARRHASFRASCVAAFFLPILFLLPFVNKPLHADDLLFVWVAEQILRAPADFYGFSIDYGYAHVPIHEVFHNPPAVSYWLALIGFFFSAGEVPYHLVMTLAAGVAGLGTYLLARDLTPRPLLTACIAILTPAFMVSASTLMADVPVLAAYVWSIYLWRRGLRCSDGRYLLGASVIVALGILCKYYAATLLPLLLTYGFLTERRWRKWCYYLAIPVVAILGFQAITFTLYGVTTLSDAAGVALASNWRTEELPATRPVLTLIFLGGCLAPLLFLTDARGSWRVHLTTGAVATVLVLPVAEGYSALQLMLGQNEPYAWPKLVLFGLMTWLGLGILFLAARACLRLGNADAVVLGLWLFGTVIFSATLNHYINARTLLPMLPAAAILLAQGLPAASRAWWRLLPAGALTLWTVIGDYEAASHGRRAVDEAFAYTRERGAQLYHIAFWGAEYYAIAGGSKAFSFELKEEYEADIEHGMPTGDILFVHSLGAQVWQSPPTGFEIVKTLSFPYRARLTTFDAKADAGFYSHRNGFLPYAIGRIPPETFLLLRWSGDGETPPGDQSSQDE